MSDFETISMQREGAVMRISFNRPDNLNSFNVKMRREFVEAARLVNVDDSVRVVTLTGAGRAFSAGADLTDDEGLSGGQGVEDDLNFEYKPGILAIHKSRKPWVAIVNGPCAGIGYSYAMACDLICMGKNAFLYQPFSAIGLVPDGGATWLLPSFVGAKRAYELMALGERLSADKAQVMGLVNRVFSDETLQDEGLAFAKELAERSPLALRYTKEAIAFAQHHSLEESIAKEAALQKFCIDSADAKNAVISFLKKQKPEWEGR